MINFLLGSQGWKVFCIIYAICFFLFVTALYTQIFVLTIIGWCLLITAWIVEYRVSKVKRKQNTIECMRILKETEEEIQRLINKNKKSDNAETDQQADQQTV